MYSFFVCLSVVNGMRYCLSVISILSFCFFVFLFLIIKRKQFPIFGIIIFLVLLSADRI